MIQLALLYRVLRFTESAVRTLHGVVALPVAVLSFVCHPGSPRRLRV